MFFLLKRGPGRPVSIRDGEMVFLTDTNQIVVGWKNETHVVSEVVEGPHDLNLYAKIPNDPQFIPLGIRRP